MDIQQDMLTVNDYSRVGTKLQGVKGLVIHWVANPNTKAKANRDFFESRKYGNKGFGSAHYIIDLDGKVIQCIPQKELAFHCGGTNYKQEAKKKLGNYPNNCTIGIECTHIDWDGKMTDDTYNSLLEICKDLCMVYKLDPMEDLYRHYDVTGKDCHKWFVDNPKEWTKFKERVKEMIDGNTATANEIKFSYQGKKFSVPGLSKDNKNYVGARELLEAMGYKVGWDNEEKTITIGGK